MICASIIVWGSFEIEYLLKTPHSAIPRSHWHSYLIKSKKHHFLHVGAIAPGSGLHGSDVALVGLLYLFEDEGTSEVATDVFAAWRFHFEGLLPFVDCLGSRGEFRYSAGGVKEAALAVWATDALDALQLIQTLQSSGLDWLILS